MSKLKHEVHEIAPKTWCLSEFRLVNAFLLEGEEKAVLIDTGTGIGDLFGVVRELTDKPVEILLTHGHFDHDGGVKQFGDAPIYLNPEDGKNMHETLKMMEKMMGSSDMNVMRKYFITSRAPIRCPDTSVEELLTLIPDRADSPIYDWLPITDGMEMNLGNRKIKAIHTPGHTDGEMSFLDVNSRILFTGDTANVGIILMRQPDNDTKLIQICNRTMKKLWDLEKEYDKLGVGHDAVTIDKQIIRDYLDLTTGLLDGTIIGSYEENGFRKGDVARLGLAELWYQCDA